MARSASRLAARIARRPMAVWGLVLIVATVLLAVAAPLISSHEPTQQNLLAFLRPPGYETADRTFLLGTDQLGRDVLSRILFGLRLSLLIAGAGSALACILGTTLGLAAGASSGSLDAVLMRVVDFQLSIPFLLIAILWVSLVGNTMLDLIIVVGIYGWVPFARIARDISLSVRRKEFVVAAAALGATRPRIILRHISPQVLPQILIVLSLTLGRAVVLEASLGFLGLGLPPPAPTLGGMIGDGRSYLTTAWWLATFPGIALFLVVIGASFAGDGLRDVLDPKTH